MFSSSSLWLYSTLFIPLTTSVWQTETWRRRPNPAKPKFCMMCSFLKITFGHCLLHLRNTAEKNRKTRRVTGEKQAQNTGAFCFFPEPTSHQDTLHYATQTHTAFMSFALFCTQEDISFRISQKCTGVCDYKAHHFTFNGSHMEPYLYSVPKFQLDRTWSCALFLLSNSA